MNRESTTTNSKRRLSTHNTTFTMSSSESNKSSSGDNQRKHHHSSKKWVAKALSRSRSASSFGKSGPPSSPRPSPPRSTFMATASPKQQQPPFTTTAEGVDLPPPSPSMPTSTGGGSSGTPKKSWEKHYRSFLRGRRFFPEKLSPPDLEKKASGESSASNKSPSSKKLMAQQQPQHDQQSNKSPSSRKLLFGGGSKIRQRSASLLLQQPDLLDNTKDAQNTDTIPFPDLTKTRSKSTGVIHKGGDAAVRGGSLFQSVFKRDRSGSTHSSSEDDTSIRRRQRSVDSDLDAVVRRGHGVAYSPDNARFKKAAAAAHTTSATTAATTTPPPPPPLFASSPKHQHHVVDMEGSVRGGKQRLVQPKHTVSLPASLLSSSKSKSKEMKVKFTEFHNSSEFAQDSTSAYLGDEPSQHRNDAFSAIYNQRSNESQLASARYTSLPLLPVTEGAEIATKKKPSRILNQPFGADTWSPGRRYLIAPAAFVQCPKQVLPMLSGHVRYGPYHQSFVQNQEVPFPTSTPPPVFGTLVLGTANVTSVGNNRKQQQQQPYNYWSSCVFVLRQNYLLEYSEDEKSSIHELPRGFAHLQHATCHAHQDFHDTLVLQYYGSPCAKADQRTLMIRVKSRQERDWWVTCLTAAAQLIIESLYEYDESVKFGHGRYATVYPARKVTTSHRENPGTTATTTPDYDCALKVIEKKEFWHRVQQGKERADTLVREVAVQATLSAKCGRLPTFLQISGFFETCDHVVMELELLKGTDLFQHMSANGVLHEDEAAHITRDLLSSLYAMTRIGVAHRDIKPANILMCRRGKDGVAVKLGDFGMSTFVKDGLVRGRCGTPGYVAPEIFGAGAKAGYGNQVDVFSAGVTLYVMLCGYEPFYGESDAELIAANREADVEFADADWKNVSAEAIDLVKRMLEADPNKRIGAREALQHPWIVTRVPPAPWLEEMDESSFDRLTLTPDEVSTDSACTLS